MRVAGVVAEYNPFHTGHQWHINKTREQADAVVCVMSGAFTQRGMPAVVDKWARAKAAVLCGADLVLELPFPFSSAPAEIFAYGAVDLLGKLGIVESLSFGSESGDITPLLKTAEILEQKSREISESIKGNAGKGKSYAAAVAQAVGEYTDDNALDSPNNLLGIKYIMALHRLGLDIKPFTVKREGDYNSTSLEGRFVSAAAIRKALAEGGAERVKAYMPDKAFQVFKTEAENGRVYNLAESDPLLAGIIRREGNAIEKYAYMAEGVENRFVSAAERFTSAADIINEVKTKRYTHTRLSRIAAAVMVGMDKKQLEMNMQGGAAYAKVLAIGENGTTLLREIKEKGRVPVISRGAEYVNLGAYAVQQFELEMKAQNIAELCCGGMPQPANSDLLKKPFIFMV